jgi:hypothetical protein
MSIPPVSYNRTIVMNHVAPLPENGRLRQDAHGERAAKASGNG